MSAISALGRLGAVVITALSMLLVGACTLYADTAQTGLEERILQIGKCRTIVEIADTPESRSTGLMHRDFMDQNRGMIFIFDRVGPVGFWMKNTRIPLEIAFLDRDLKVLAIARMKPFDLSQTRGPDRTLYALEVNPGHFGRCGSGVGETLEFVEE
ncbi:MAG: DUF192 domain-containing protein [Pseudomonadota bacterium]